MIQIILAVLFCLSLVILYKLKQNKQIDYGCVNCNKSVDKPKSFCSEVCKQTVTNTPFWNRYRNHVKRQGRITGHELTYQQWLKTLDYFNHQCAYCHIYLEPEFMEIDHFMPVDEEYLFQYKNIIPSCRNCNRVKSNKDGFEFIQTISKSKREALLNFLT